MSADREPAASTDIARLIESARRLGVEMNEAEAIQWLTAIAAWKAQGDVVLDTRHGVFGHAVVMLDFSAQELARFREIARLIEIPDRPGTVETALALSGSAAQSKIQTYPGDCDFFERVNIKAPSRAQACQILAGLMREKALGTLRGPTYQLIEVKFGSCPRDLVRDGRRLKAGAPLSWAPEEICAGEIHAVHLEGSPLVLRWDEVAMEPGWCKLDWVVADPQRGQVANATNMLDVTWEGPDGTITPLDGYLDPYFQEVYLEADSIPLFSKLVRQLSADALDGYVARLEGEVRKHLASTPNYGKAAKRMYNIFRLTGRYHEAAYVRELFDEPATLLYQVWSLIRTLDDATRAGSSISTESLLSQTDGLIAATVDALEGHDELRIGRQLKAMRDGLAAQAGAGGLTAVAEEVRAEILALVNEFFYERLAALPSIKTYMDGLNTQAPG